MAEPIGALRVELSANAAQFEKDMGRARNAARQSSNAMTKSFNGVGSSIAATIGRLFTLRTAIVSIGAATVIGYFIKRQIAAADAIAKTADKVGVGIEALQEYRYAADLAGVGQQTLDMALQRFSRRFGEAAQGTGELKDTLKQYGIETRDAEGRTRKVEDALLDYADAIQGAESDQERLRLAFKGFDSEGAALVNLFKNGSEGIKRMRQEARDLGIVLDERMVREAEKANDQFTRMERILGTQLTKVAISLAPEIIKLGQAFAAAAPHIARFIGSLLPENFAPVEELESRLQSLRDTLLDKEIRSQTLGKLFPGTVTAELDGLRQQIDLLEKLIEKRKQEDALIQSALNSGGDVIDQQAAKIEEIITNLQFELDQLGRTEAGQKLYSLAKSAGIEVNQAFADKVLPLVAALEAEKKALDDAADAAKARQKALEEADSLELKRQYEAQNAEIERQKDLTDKNAEAVRDLGLTFTSAFEEAVISGGKLSDILQGLADDLLKLALRQLVLQPILQAATGFLGGLTGGGDIGAVQSQAKIDVATLPFFAAGGTHRGGFRIVGENGPELEATGPSRIYNAEETAAMIGGVNMTGGGDVQVNVYAPPGSNVQTRETQGPGGRSLDVIIDEANAKLINTPGSRTGRALQTRFGNQTTLKGRG